MLVITLLLTGAGAGIFITAGVRWASMQKLLQEGKSLCNEKPTSGNSRNSVLAVGNNNISCMDLFNRCQGDHLNCIAGGGSLVCRRYGDLPFIHRQER